MVSAWQEDPMPERSQPLAKQQSLLSGTTERQLPSPLLLLLLSLSASLRASPSGQLLPLGLPASRAEPDSRLAAAAPPSNENGAPEGVVVSRIKQCVASLLPPPLQRVNQNNQNRREAASGPCLPSSSTSSRPRFNVSRNGNDKASDRFWFARCREALVTLRGWRLSERTEDE